MPNPITGDPRPADAAATGQPAGPSAAAGRPAAAVPRPGPPTTEAAVPRHAVVDGEMALRLPDWDLLPPAEFLDRRRGGR
ncbi:hypothetical protein [Saccharothrix sp.]|uniref:hypothetical protein n=1 Tax=Saccharothrix sp. TaxID=1873460 RepID=UPI002810E88D|nr:hypothetical protein [Saccharothrix sp.]